MTNDFNRGHHRRHTRSSSGTTSARTVGNPDALPIGWRHGFHLPQPGGVDACSTRGARHLRLCLLPPEFRAVTERWMQLRHGGMFFSAAQILHASGTMRCSTPLYRLLPCR